MAITNGYVTLAQVIAEMGTSSITDKDARIEQAINSASRDIDNFAGRRFWQDPTVVAREYYADSWDELLSTPTAVLDISTATGLIVKLDDDDDGTFATTLTIGTHFVLTPRNAAADSEPFTGIRLVDSLYSIPRSSSGRPGIQVTAKFGFASVPAAIEQACLIQSVLHYKATDAAMGGLSFGDGAFMRVRGELNPIAKGLVSPYSFARVA